MPGAAMTTRDVTTLIMMKIMNDTHDDHGMYQAMKG